MKGESMKNVNILRNTVIAGILCGMSSLSYAADAAGPAKHKFGVVDMQNVILNVEEGKQARADLEKEIKAKEKELQGQKEALDKMNEEWKTQASVLSEDARMKKQKEFQEKFMNLRNAEMKFQSEIKQKEQKATQQIAVKVASMVEKIAKEKQLEAVFEMNSAGLLYLDNPLDLTKEITEKYGKDQKLPGSSKTSKR